MDNTNDSLERQALQLAAEMKSEQPADMAQPGYGTIAPEQMQEAAGSVELEKQYGSRPVEALAVGLAKGLLPGIGVPALIKSGLISKDAARELLERNELAGLTGEVGGFIAPFGEVSLLAKGVESVLAKTAAKGVASLGEKAAAKAVSEVVSATGRKKLLQQVAEKGAKLAAYSGEGAALGAANLIDESALGRADLNAENLAMSAGAGALLNLGAAGVLGLANKAAPVVGKGIESLGARLRGTAKSALDPIEATKSLSGLTPKFIQKMESREPEFWSKAHQYLKDELGTKLFMTPEERALANETVINSAADRLGQLTKLMDDNSSLAGLTKVDREQVFGNMLRRVDDRLQEFQKAPSAYKAEISALQDFKTDIATYLTKDAPLDFKEMNDLRKLFQDKAYKFGTPIDTLRGQMANELRWELRKGINDVADRISVNAQVAELKGLAAELRDTNNKLHIGLTLQPGLSKRAGKVQDLFSFSDIVEPAAAIQLGGPAGLIPVAIKKLMKADVTKNWAVLGDMQKMQNKFNTKLESSVAQFISKPLPKVTRPLSTQVLLNSGFAVPEGKREAPKTRKQAFKQISENLIKYNTEPDYAQKKLIKAAAALDNVAPNTANELRATLARSVQFLNSKLPRPQLPVQQFGFKREYEPSGLEIGKFERYLQAVEHPASVLEDLQSGAVTREQVEAIRAVYPQLYAKIRQQVMDAVATHEENLPYNKRVQLGVLLDLPTDPSLQPDHIIGLQANFAQPEAPVAQGQAGAVKTTAGGLEHLGQAERSMSGTQAIIARRNT